MIMKLIDVGLALFGSLLGKICVWAECKSTDTRATVPSVVKECCNKVDP